MGLGGKISDIKREEAVLNLALDKMSMTGVGCAKFLTAFVVQALLAIFLL